MEERKCLECGEILKGRSDQKFCGDQCRSAYNNRRFGDVNAFIKRVDRTLKKNRTILFQLNPGGKTTLPKTELGKHGFDFAYHTHTYSPAGPGNTFFRNKVNVEGIFIYDISLNQNLVANSAEVFTDEKGVAPKSFFFANRIKRNRYQRNEAKLLPRSLYLDSVPLFLSGKTLPILGPNVKGNPKLPARERFEKGYPVMAFPEKETFKSGSREERKDFRKAR